jgi:hypothetical protein
MLNKCAIEIVSLSIIAAFDGNTKNLKQYVKENKCVDCLIV